MRSITSQRQLERTLSQIDSNLEWERDMAAEAATLYMVHCFRKLAQHFRRHRFGCQFSLGTDSIHMTPAFRGYTSITTAIGLMYRKGQRPSIRRLHSIVLDLEKIARKINDEYDRQLAIGPVDPDGAPPIISYHGDDERHRHVDEAFRRAYQEANDRRERLKRALWRELSG
jgi:hypothetical protein